MKKIAFKALGVLMIGALIGMVGSAVTAQQAQPIPSANNEDVQIVAGLLLAQELLDIASREAVTPAGMVKLAAAPILGWEAVGGTGLTAQARAAAGSSGLARSEVLLAPATPDFSVTPTIKIKNPLLQRAGTAQNKMLETVYKAMIEAEAAGQMELAYALASIYLTNGLFNFFNRGIEIGFARINSCLSGEDTKLEISDPSTGKSTEFPLECSKYKALQAVVATEIAPGAFSFFGPLADLGCEQLLGLSVNAKQTGLRLAAARAYVQGVQIVAGIFGECIPADIEALIAAIKQAKANGQQELLQELVGYDYQIYTDGKSVTLYSSFANRRGLSKVLQDAETALLEQLAQDAENPEIGLAAYYELGVRWADKPEAELRDLIVNGKTPAVRRAATKALLLQLGRAFDVQCLQSLANGQECK